MLSQEWVKFKGMGRVLMATLGCALLAGVMPATSAASGSDFAVMLSDPGEYIGGGSQRVFQTGDSSITLS